MSTANAVAAGLRVQALSKSYPAPTGDLVVLRDVTFELSPDESLAVLGPSGSGKSTLLNILGGLDRPSGGTASIRGIEPSRLPEPELASFRNRQVGFVFQEAFLLPQCSVLENVLVPTLANRGVLPEFEARARELLARVGLADRTAHRPAELSGGERQRVALCRALINQPVLLLADEPTGNLDRRAAENVASLLLELFEREARFLIVATHSPELAARLGRRMRLDDGVLVEA